MERKEKGRGGVITSLNVSTSTNHLFFERPRLFNTTLVRSRLLQIIIVSAPKVQLEEVKARKGCGTVNTSEY